MTRKQLLLSCALLILSGCATTPTNLTPEEQFKAGEAYFNRGRYEDAITQWKKAKESYRSPELTAQAELKIADAHFANKAWIEAAAAYDDFRKLHPKNEKSEYALFRSGLANFNQISGIDTDQTPLKNATSTFETFLREYPSSQYAPEAKKMLQECHVKAAENEIYIARFYLRTDKYLAAIRRMEALLISSPDLPVLDQALFVLGSAYLESGDKVKGKKTLNRLIKEYPRSKFAEDARSLLKN